jgi:hypothetical protein
VETQRKGRGGRRARKKPGDYQNVVVTIMVDDDDALLRVRERAQGGERREGCAKFCPNLNTSLFSFKCMEST